MSKQGKSISREDLSAQTTWFDKLSSVKKDAFCIGVLLLLIYILFWDVITKNMILSTDSGDAQSHLSWAQAIKHIDETEHTDPLWIPYVFGGMPIFSTLLFQKMVNYAEWLVQLPGKIIFFSCDLNYFVMHYFLAGVFMYLLARRLNLSQIPSLFAGIVLMLHPHTVDLGQAFHGSKLAILSYVPLLFLLTMTLFEKRSLLTFSLLALTIGTMMLNRHPQMAFYGLLMIGSYVVYDTVLRIKQQPVEIAKTASLIVLALVIGFAIYAYEFLPTREYTLYSVRGGGTESATGGANYDWATNWSMHPFELVSYVIPSSFGFSAPYYWGWMPFTDCPEYIGIVPLLLAILALIYKRNRVTRFLAIFSALVFLISFGNFLPVVYNLFFYYVPYFNKFRAPSMILYLIPVTFGILAAYGLSFLMELPQHAKEFDIPRFRKRLVRFLAVLGGLLVIGFIAKDGVYSFLSDFMFSRSSDLPELRQQYGNQAAQILPQLKQLRFGLFADDYVKITFLVAAFLGLVIAYLNQKISKTTMAFGCVAILVIDLTILDVKFINPKPKTTIEESFTPDATTQFLQRDSSLFRVFPLGNLWQDNTMMYHSISSIGGYSPAKLRIYQQLIDSTGLYPPKLPINMNVVNMLNCKYLTAQGRLPGDDLTPVFTDEQKQIITYRNPHALPRAYFVDGVVISKSTKETFTMMNSSSWNSKTTAILEKDPATTPKKSDSTNVSIESYLTREMKLTTFSSGASLLVLSEVYYPAGWKAFIDGTETEIYKTNYVLRSIVVPAGNHTVEFRFDPQTYALGYTITQGAWGVTILLLIVGIIQLPAVKSRLRKNEMKVDTA